MAETISTAKLKKASGENVKERFPRRAEENRPAWKEEVGADLKEDSKPMGRGVFAVLLGLAILLDVIDLVDFTGVGIVISTVASFVFGAGFFLAFYFYDPERDVAATKSMIKKTAAFIAELIPGIGVLPINSLMVVYVYLISQPQFKEKVDQAFQATEAGKKALAAAEKLKKASTLVRAGK